MLSYKVLFIIKLIQNTMVSVQMINISKILKKKVISTIMYVRLSDSE